MPIEIFAIGGYEEVGKNMTAVKVDDEVIILDLGINLEPYIKYTEDEDIKKISPQQLIKVNALPDVNKLRDWKDKVKAIVTTHAHLDHCGGIPYLSNSFKAPIICSPYTAAVLKAIITDEKISMKNRILVLNPNSTYQVTNNLIVEFIHITHSTPQTVVAAIHTKYGVILYAVDFKLDKSPVLGKEANIDRLKEIGKQGNVLLLIMESTYAQYAVKTPSEAVAKQMLHDVLLGSHSEGKAVIVTTFSSHLARIKSIIELGKQLNRKIVFLGRSMSKYAMAGESIQLVNFSKEAEFVKFSSKVKKRIKQIMKEGKEKYLLIVTGHQGEPRSILPRMVSGQLGFNFDREDHIIFSCRVIPSETNIANREKLEEQLRKLKVRIFKDIHVSGHAAREDLRDMINYLQPKNILPAHGEMPMREALADLAYEMGYSKDKVHMILNEEKIVLQ